MTSTITAFIVHDMTHFPVIWQHPDAVRPGYAGQWQREMDALLEWGEPFVVIFAADHPEEAHEDRKLRGLWLKHNKSALARLCRATISLEPNDVKRIILKTQLMMASKAFGIPMDIAPSAQDAETLARTLLSAHAVA